MSCSLNYLKGPAWNMAHMKERFRGALISSGSKISDDWPQ